MKGKLYLVEDREKMDQLLFNPNVDKYLSLKCLPFQYNRIKSSVGGRESLWQSG